MPTKKHRVQTILEDDTYEMFTKIAEEEQRSESSMAKYIITNFIKSYKLKETNGNIIQVNGGKSNIQIAAEYIPDMDLGKSNQ